MPKARTPLDMERIEALQRQGLSRRQIAQELGMAESTLRDNLRAMQQAQASPGLPQGDQGPPQGNIGIPQNIAHVHQGPPQEDQGLRTPSVSLGPPQPDQAGTVVLAGRTPPPHQGRPEDTTGGPHNGTPEVSLGGPLTLLSTQDLQDLQALLVWWRDRQRYAQEPSEKLERATYHVAPKWIDAVKREAALTHESYAAIVNRAFAQYFAQRST